MEDAVSGSKLFSDSNPFLIDRREPISSSRGYQP
jgi:hypothetical protein